MVVNKAHTVASWQYKGINLSDYKRPPESPSDQLMRHIKQQEEKLIMTEIDQKAILIKHKELATKIASISIQYFADLAELGEPKASANKEQRLTETDEQWERLTPIEQQIVRAAALRSANYAIDTLLEGGAA